MIRQKQSLLLIYIFIFRRQGNPEESIPLIATGNTQCRHESEASGSSTPQSSSPPLTNRHLSDGIDISMVPSVNCIVNMSHFVDELTEVILHRFKCGNLHSNVFITKVSSIGLRTSLVAECGACKWKKIVKTNLILPQQV